MSKKTPNSKPKQRSGRRPVRANGTTSSGRPKRGSKATKKATSVGGRTSKQQGARRAASSKSVIAIRSGATHRPSFNPKGNACVDSKSEQSIESKTKSTHKVCAEAAQFNVKPYFIEVDAEHAGQRVDNFLMTRLKGVPKTHIYRIIRKGEVRVNKGRVKQTTRLQESDMVRIPPIRLADQSLKDLDGSRYEFLRKTVLFEDDALLVINKPSGMAVHAGSGIKVGVIEALRALRTDLKYLELVHRLDRETSGCLVLAKKSSALRILHEDFKTNSLKNKRLDKRYMALVQGHWKFGPRRIIKPLNTDARKHGERHVVVDQGGSYASSIVSPVDVSDEASLVEVKLLTGRTHQVRVHVLSEGHPIAGDQRYGDIEFNKQAKKHKLSRLFLHASRLSFNHPLLDEAVTVIAELPDDLKSVAASFKLCIN